MTSSKPAAPDERLPSGRVVRWIALAGVILFSVVLYFKFGLHTPPLGSTPGATSTSSP